MIVQLTKWGNSLAVRIPSAYAKELGATENSQAEIIIEDGRLVLTPVREMRRFDLDTLIAQITDENRHEEISTGPAQGDEFA